MPVVLRRRLLDVAPAAALIVIGAAQLLAELETQGVGQEHISTRAATRTFEEVVGQFLSDQVV